MKPGKKPVQPGEPVSPGDMQVLLVHRPRYRDWSWPKGKAEANEPLPVTAVREVEEETGKVVALGAPLTTQRYRLGSGHLKEVYYWVGQILGKDPARAARHPVGRASRKEIDIVQWVGTGQARAMLTRRGDRRLLTELIGRGARGELQTTTMVLLRHAKAVDREKWTGTEADRPLTRMGGAQALDLVPLLSAFGVERLISSPWRRCEQTVAPYAAVSSAPMRTDERLTEDAVRQNPEDSMRLTRKLMEGNQVAAAVSFHGPGLPALLDPVRERAQRRIVAAMDQPSPQLRKGEMLVVHVSLAPDRKILEVERHRPLTRMLVA